MGVFKLINIIEINMFICQLFTKLGPTAQASLNNNLTCNVVVLFKTLL